MSGPREWCPFCAKDHDPHCTAYRAPDVAVAADPSMGCGRMVEVGRCGQLPASHIHAPHCGNGQDDLHHDWEPWPGSLIEAYLALAAAS